MKPVCLMGSYYLMVPASQVFLRVQVGVEARGGAAGCCVRPWKPPFLFCFEAGSFAGLHLSRLRPADQ